MISKIRGGILSCIGLITINLIGGVILIPNLNVNHLMIYIMIVKFGFVWFSISLWIVLKYDLVKLNNLDNLKKPLDWLIRNLAIVSGVSIISTFSPSRETYALIIVAGIILLVNYIIVFVKFYKLDKEYLEFVGDIHNYIIAMIVIALIYSLIRAINEFTWHIELDYLFQYMRAIPILFLMKFLIREKKDIEKKLTVYSIE